MKTSTAIKMFAIAIMATATMAASNVNAEERTKISSSRMKLTPTIDNDHLFHDDDHNDAPTLGFYGRASHRGMMVTDVIRGSEAWDIGLERGDVITEINGQHIHSQRDYDRAMQRAGRHMRLKVRDVRGRGIVTVHAHPEFDNRYVR